MNTGWAQIKHFSCFEGKNGLYFSGELVFVPIVQLRGIWKKLLKPFQSRLETSKNCQCLYKRCLSAKKNWSERFF